MLAIESDAATLTALIASFFAGIGAILAWTLKLLKQIRIDGPSRREVTSMIRSQTPYIADRRLIIQTLRQNQKQISALTDAVSKLTATELHHDRRLLRAENDIRDLLNRSNQQ